MSVVGIVHHTGRARARDLAVELAGWLRADGHEVRVAGEGDGPDVDLGDRGFGAGLDLAVSLGGDGNVLRTVALVAEHDVPILGVNVGQLGYLTVVEPADARSAIARVLAGEHQIERRMMLDVRLVGGEHDGLLERALNEVVLERTSASNTIRVGVGLDGEFFTTYACDGLIVATPTGSTAYAFSVRGPIIAATHRAQLLTPVSPHMLFDRSLVLEPETVVRLDVRGDRHASLSVDGRTIGLLRDGDAIVCTESTHSALLVTFGPRDFHAVLKAKFGLNDR